MRDKPNTDSHCGRVPIWSVGEEYHNAFSIMLPTFWFAGMTAYVVHRWASFSNADSNASENDVLGTVVQVIQDIGVVGLSSTVLAIMVVAIIAGGKAAMVLIDRARQAIDRTRQAKIRAEIQSRRDAEWGEWITRRDEAVARGENFKEPSPAERTGDSQGA